MRRTTFLVFTSLALACAPPTLELSRSELDFGTVETLRGPFRVVLLVSNPGGSTLHPRVTLSPAPGLAVEWPVDALAPEATERLILTWDPPADATLDTTLELSAEAGRGTKTLTVHGQAVSPEASLSWGPGQSCAGTVGSIDFGTVANGQPVTRTVLVHSVGTGAFSVSRVRAQTALAGVTVTGPFRVPIEPGATSEFEVSYDPRIPGGLDHTLVLDTTSLRVGALSVPVCGFGLVSALCASPAPLDFGQVDAGSTLARSITAESCGNLPIDVLSLELTPLQSPFAATAPTLPRTLAPGESFEVPVTVTAPSETAQRSLLTLTTASPATPLVTAELGANLPPPCRLSLGASSLTFYNAATNRSLRLTNLGTSPCRLDRASIAPPDRFAFERALSLPLTIDGRSSLELPLVYTPGTSGTTASTAQLELEFDFVHRVTLVGTPRAPPTCRLVAASPQVSFHDRPTATVGLLNVGTQTCHVSSVTLDRPEYAVSPTSLDVPALSTAFVVLSHQLGPAQSAPDATLTALSDDLFEGQLDIAVVKSHFCNESCMCDDTQMLAYWQFSSGLSSAASSGGPLGSFFRSCEPRSCPGNEVQLEESRGTTRCVAAPPTCEQGQGLSYSQGNWSCVTCATVVQFGFLFDYQRVCAPTPPSNCGPEEAPTFDAATKSWSCRKTCDNGLYDRRMFDGRLVCVPC